MADLIKSVKEKNQAAYDQHELFSYNFGGFADEIFKNHVKNSNVKWTWKSLFYGNEIVCNDSTLLFSQGLWFC